MIVTNAEQKKVLVNLYRDIERLSTLKVEHRNLDDATLAFTANGPRPIYTFRGVMYYKTKAYQFSESFVDTTTLQFATLTNDNSEQYSEDERVTAANLLKEITEEVLREHGEEIIQLFTAASSLKITLNALGISTLDYYDKEKVLLRRAEDAKKRSVDDAPDTDEELLEQKVLTDKISQSQWQAIAAQGKEKD